MALICVTRGTHWTIHAYPDNCTKHQVSDPSLLDAVSLRSARSPSSCSLTTHYPRTRYSIHTVSQSEIVNNYQPYLESIWDCVFDQLMRCLLGKSRNKATAPLTPYQNIARYGWIPGYECTSKAFLRDKDACWAFRGTWVEHAPWGYQAACLCALCIDFAILPVYVSVGWEAWRADPSLLWSA